MCSKTCDSDCPLGWDCTLVGSTGDGQYACVSQFSRLCLPCADSGDCSTEKPSACVKYSDGGQYCGGACDLETTCPSGYSCQEVETASGGTSYQCVNTAGVCPCSTLAIESALSTTCEVTNEAGTCEGVRICEEDGLSDCTAATPSVEICNGIDDDCNGLVDEVDCDDGNDCTVDVCAGEAGCTHEAMNEGECLDGDACTIGDHCEAGVCVGTEIDCEDGNPCTADSCDGLGGCASVPQAAVCDDGDPCTLGDICQDGACAGSANLTCDDGNPCTDDSCGESGCVYEPNIASCDDGNACTDGDTCAAGACQGSQITCDDGNLCTTDSCDLQAGCVTVNNAQPCDDGDGCTVGDVCLEGSCVSGKTTTCDDGNSCTDDACDSVLGCVFTANNEDCDDTNSCTTGDACVEGNCIGLGDLSCDDGNPCTEDSCLANGGCSNLVVAGPCDDGDACTVNDACVNGTCESGSVIGCDDGNPCTDEACVGGDCVFTPNAAECNDGNACTLGDVCQGGWCSFTEFLGCDDGNPCTDDACNVETGCVFANNTNPCSDGDLCTVGDVCSDGACTAGVDELACDDGVFCNGEESCDPAKGCIPGEAPSNDDGVDCTVEACDEEQGAIVSTPNNQLCSVPPNSLCQIAVCDAAQGCLVATEANCCGNGIVEGAEDCDDANQVDDDGCSNACQAPLGTEVKPAASCNAIKTAGDDVGNGLYWLKPDPQGNTFEAFCEMERDVGGWTLIAVSAQDGQATWTRNNRHYWDTDTTTFGDVNLLANDFKSPAYHAVSFSDLMFVHVDSDVWAGYHNVGNGQSDLGSFIFDLTGGELLCNSAGDAGYPQSSGTLTNIGKLCNTRLYFNSNDQDGSGSCFVDNAAYGPTWSAGNNNGCPMDDPGQTGSLGPDASAQDGESAVYGGLGFGWALDILGGSMRVYVR